MASLLHLTILNLSLLTGLLCNPMLKVQSKISKSDVDAKGADPTVKSTDSFESQLFENLKDWLKDEYISVWQGHKKNYGKKYSTYEEEQQRFLIFVENYQKIQHHNLRYKLGLTSFALGLNQFADLETAEFKKIFNGYKRKPINSPSESSSFFVEPDNTELPKEVDWRKEGYVTPVKDQGQCGSCWAFSTTGSLEGQHFRKSNGTLVSLSEQNLVDCSAEFGNNGCDGGLMDLAFQYVMQNGLDTEKSYPYEAVDDKCRFKNSTIGTNEQSFEDIESGNETALAYAVAGVGPISVAIDASSIFFQFYKSGVYCDPFCSSENLDHGVLAVGYGETRSGKNYWIVKNSWGESWGDEGYIKMAKDEDNNCGIATAASYPIV